MAVTWEVKITVLNVDEKIISVHATRTDTITGAVTTYDVAKAPIRTPEQKLTVVNEIWQKHLDAAAKQSKINEVISGLETDAKANLEARE